MKNRILLFAKTAAALVALFLMPDGVFAQAGDYMARIKQPAVDTIRKCPGDNIIFQAECHNDDGTEFNDSQVTYVWEFGYDGQVVTGKNVSFSYPAGGHYLVKLTVRGVSGPDAKNSPEVHVYVGIPPFFTNTRSDKSSFCDGSEIILTGYVTPKPWTGDSFPFTNVFEPADFTWDGIGIQSSRNEIARVKPPLDQGHKVYRFIVKDDFGCVHDTSLLVYGVYADFSMDPIIGEAPLEVTFTVDSASNGGWESSMTHEWEFVENSDTASRITSTLDQYTFEIPGEYTCRMKASYLQCTYIFTHEDYIRVDSSLLEIPNVFTPNEDGANDYFQVKSRSLKTFHGVIYNRWGRMVFEWTDPKTFESGWNGRFQNTGGLCPSGTYYYVIRATGYDKNKSEPGPDYPDIEYEGGIYKGFVTLIR